MSYSTGDVDAANNYWAGDVDEKVYVEAGSVVTGLDDVKTEPVLDQAAEEPGITDPGTNESGASNQEQTGSSIDKESDSPKTGDDTLVLGYIIMMLAAAGISGTLLANRKKN